MYIIFGALSFFFIFLTVFSGLFLRKLRLKILHHKMLAVISLIFAILHLILIYILS